MEWRNVTRNVLVITEFRRRPQDEPRITFSQHQLGELIEAWTTGANVEPITFDRERESMLAKLALVDQGETVKTLDTPVSAIYILPLSEQRTLH